MTFRWVFFPPKHRRMLYHRTCFVKWQTLPQGLICSPLRGLGGKEGVNRTPRAPVRKWRGSRPFYWWGAGISNAEPETGLGQGGAGWLDRYVLTGHLGVKGVELLWPRGASLGGPSHCSLFFLLQNYKKKKKFKHTEKVKEFHSLTWAINILWCWITYPVSIHQSIQ